MYRPNRKIESRAFSGTMRIAPAMTMNRKKTPKASVHKTRNGNERGDVVMSVS
jgi:hypothetical protein